MKRSGTLAILPFLLLMAAGCAPVKTAAPGAAPPIPSHSEAAMSMQQYPQGHGVIRLAGVQFAGIPNQKQANMDKAERLIRQAAAEGAQIIMTPEVVLTGFPGGDDERKMAEPIPGPATARFGELARKLGVYILVGLSELDQGEIRNAMAVLSPEGRLMGVMRKVHINAYEVPGGWRNGSAFPVWRFETPTGAMTGGIMICYDRELPESARLLMLQGADVIFNPLATVCPTIDIHRSLLRTRAFENELYILMTNHAAPSQNGHSFAVNYSGDITDELDDGEGVLIVDIDIDKLNEYRKTGIYGPHHRRPELYRMLTDPRGQIHPEGANLPPETGQ